VTTMHKQMKYLIITVLLLVFTTTSFSVAEKNNILYISSYSPSFATFEDQMKGLRSVLKDEYSISIQYMDSKEFYSEALIEDFKSQLSKKMSMRDFELVLVADDNAYNLALEEKDGLFKDLPIVFFGVNNQSNAMKANDFSEITGVIESISIKETIDSGLALQKKAKSIHVITDPTPTGQSDLETFRKYVKDYPGIDFKIHDTSNLTFSELSKILNEISSDDLVLFLSLYRDETGESFLFSESVAFVLDNTSVPVLHIYKHGIGGGMLGGHVVDHYKQGHLAGLLVNAYFDNGSLKDSFVIDESPNTYYFDAEVMEKYGFEISQLPKESMIINNEKSFFEKYRYYIVTFIGLFIFEAFLIFYLLYNLKKRRAYEKELIKTNNTLETQYEEIIAQYTELEETKKALATSRSRYVLAFEGSNSGIFDQNFKEEHCYINAPWYNQFLEKPLVDSDDFSQLIALMPGEQRQAYQTLKEKIFASDERIYDIEFFIELEGSHEKIWILENGVITRNEKNEVTRVIGTHREITHLKQNIERIKELKVYDHLTKLYNRNALELHLKRMLSDENPKAMAIVLIDLDNFKYINDQYGHHRGDEILKILSNRLMQNNVADYISRFGGDEFVLILNNMESIDVLIEKLYSIKYFIEEEILIHSDSYHMHASFGIVLSPKHGSDYNELLRKADLAMYQVKSAENKVWYQIYDPSISQNFERKIKRIQEIQYGIKNNEFYMVYQPIVDCISGEIYAVEALMRWEHAGVFVSPDEFITLAEKSGHIYELGLVSILDSIEYLKEINVGFKMSINLSPIQLKDSKLMAVLEETIKKFHVPFDKIIIEITETAVIENFGQTIEILEGLKKLGIKIALDDFGTGYSSLSYLTKLPIDIIKVDKSFVQQIQTKDETMDLIEAIVAIAVNRNLKVIFEGIETEEQLEILNSLGCNYSQGYYFFKPLDQKQLNQVINS